MYASVNRPVCGCEESLAVAWQLGQCELRLDYIMCFQSSNFRHIILTQHSIIPTQYYWGERERAPPLMMSTALASVRPSLRPRTSRRLRMRDIHVIYADSNSADFAGFKNRVQAQQERDRQTRLERRRQQERERRARETPEERDRRRSLRNQRDRERRRARCAARCASALAQLERVCTCIIIRIRIYIRELAHARPPMSSISLVPTQYYTNTHMNIIAERISARQYKSGSILGIRMYARTYVRSVICAGAYE